MNTIYADTINRIPTNLLCLIFVAFVSLLSLAGMHLYDIYIGRKTVPHNNEVIGIIFGAISLIYSLILAFVILAVWEDYEDLSKTIGSETDRLNSILAHSATLPGSVQQPIKSALTTYCNQVISTEWDMRQTSVADGPSAIPDLRLMLLQIEPQNKVEESIYAVLDEDLSYISDLRRNRLSYNHSHVPDLVWFTLKAGSVMLIVFYYFLNVPSVTRKRFYLVFLSSYIALCMFLLYSLDRPFSGKVQVSKHPFENVLVLLKQDNSLTQK